MELGNLLAAREWRVTSRRNAAGDPWHISKGGQVLPVVIVARAELVRLGGNAKHHYSITGEVYNPRARRRYSDGVITGGAIHDIIAEYWPQLAPLINIHLADIDGVPMHAADNAAYWAGLTKYHARAIDTLARHLRVTHEIAADMAGWVDNFFGDTPAAYDSVTTPAMAWAAAIDHYDLPGQWLNDADIARGLLHPVSVGGGN
jgi:hypothetical protein